MGVTVHLSGKPPGDSFEALYVAVVQLVFAEANDAAKAMTEIEDTKKDGLSPMEITNGLGLVSGSKMYHRGKIDVAQKVSALIQKATAL